MCDLVVEIFRSSTGDCNVQQSLETVDSGRVSDILGHIASRWPSQDLKEGQLLHGPVCFHFFNFVFLLNEIGANNSKCKNQRIVSDFLKV